MSSRKKQSVFNNIYSDMDKLFSISNEIENIQNPYEAARKALALAHKLKISRTLGFEIHDPSNPVYSDPIYREFDNKVLSSVEKSYFTEFQCCVPNCTGTAIQKSHTLQKSTILKSISDSSDLVYQTKLSPFNSDKNLKKINIKVASIFPGFCSRCETSVFQDVEKTSFDINRKNVGKLIWRGMCLSRFRSVQEVKSRAEIISFPEIYKLTEKYKSQIHVMPHLIALKESIYGYKNLNFQIKRMEEDIFESKENFSFLVLNVSTTPLIGCGAIGLPIGINGEHSEKEGNFYEIIPSLAFSFFLCEDNSYLALAFRKNDSESMAMHNHIINSSKQDIEFFLSQLLISGSDTIYIRPNFWEDLPYTDKNIFLSYQHSKTPFSIPFHKYGLKLPISDIRHL